MAHIDLSQPTINKVSPLQIIDLDEAISLEKQGIVVPESVIKIPVSLSEEPKLFNEVAKIVIELPDISVEEIVNTVKIATNPEVAIVNVEKLSNEFQGEAAVKIVADIQAGIPLSKETSEILVQKKIITTPEKYSEINPEVIEKDYTYNNPEDKTIVTNINPVKVQKTWEEILSMTNAKEEDIFDLSNMYPEAYQIYLNTVRKTDLPIPTKQIYSEINPEVIEHIYKEKPLIELSEDILGNPIYLETNKKTGEVTEITHEEVKKKMKTAEEFKKELDIMKAPARAKNIENLRLSKLGILDRITEYIYKIIYKK